jgi:hypothetical protein
MWTWTCTGCGAKFARPEKADAQQAFFEHVTEKHPRAAVFSVAPNTPEES